MRHTIEMLKSWKKLAEPKISHIIIITLVKIYIAVLEIIEVAIGATLITSLTSGDYTRAFIFLSIGLVIALGIYIVDYLAYLYHPVSTGYSYNIIQNKIFNKLKISSKENYKIHSKEKILNIFHRDGWTIADFTHILSIAISRILKIIIIFVTVIKINVYVGLLAIVIAIVNYFILANLNKKLVKTSSIVATGRDKLQETFSRIIDGSDIINDVDNYDETRKEYNELNKQFVNDCIDNNFSGYAIDRKFKMYIKVLIFVITIFMIILVSKDGLQLALYFMIISYVTSFIDSANSFFSVFRDLEIVNISVARINTILGFKENKIIEYGNNLTDNIEGTINISDVSYFESEGDFKGRLENANLTIKAKDITLLFGPKESGKRNIFYLLRRLIKPESGSVYIDGIDIYEYAPNVFKSNVSYAISKPVFLKETIIDNLKMVEKNKNRIIEACNLLGIKEQIDNLPDKFNTNIENKAAVSNELRYLIGLARAILTKSEIILLYEFPMQLSNKGRTAIRKCINEIKHTKTIVVFSGNEECLDMTKNIYYISSGKVSNKK